eukprot:TRINITY_DN23007_c0_g1_i1.p1 TRINITY_DN23007_c0_g1~~TRINITY_DN23007_c0_g1_i1.p1  ORF type:complete len:515 (+),score=56.21 TRINITY_DN23007_c0_g1_i1:26-1570(+)
MVPYSWDIMGSSLGSYAPSCDPVGGVHLIPWTLLGWGSALGDISCEVWDDTAFQVLLFLDRQDAGRVAAVGKNCALSSAAQNDALWALYSKRTVVGQSSVSGSTGSLPKGPDGEGCNSWRHALSLWSQASRKLGLSLETNVHLRWVSAWYRLRKWLAKNLPEVDATLRIPAAARTLSSLQAFTGSKAVSPLVAGLWQIRDGQVVPVEPGLAGELGMPVLGALNSIGAKWLGLFGGFAVYDYEISLVFLSLQSGLAMTRILRQSLAPLRTEHPELVAFACSSNFSKILLVDVCKGSVFAWTRKSAPMLEPAAPDNNSGDGILCWMEEYIRRLEQQIYQVAVPGPGSPMSGISLFPQGEGMSLGCARGVEVTGSCVYMPEHPQGWCYSIALRLVDTSQDRGFSSCQLKSRRWMIQEDGREPEYVEGEGVVGMFPILMDEGWLLNAQSDPHDQYHSGEVCTVPGPFRYQSCAGRNASMKGYMSGELWFVPGTITSPTGASFSVTLPPFRLAVPEYIF